MSQTYEARGGPGSGLGFPVSGAAVEMKGNVQAFEGGCERLCG
jgi:hypothetical protein